MSIQKFGLDPDKFGLSQDDAVLNEGRCFGLEKMVKLVDLIQALGAWARSSNKSLEVDWFTDEGYKCQILRTKVGGWQKGRFRIRLEFIPDNPEAFMEPIKPESPLDDLRSNLDI